MKPQAGMGATIQVGSDMYAATIIRVTKSLKTIELQYDKALPTKAMRAGMAEHGLSVFQSYLYVPNPDGKKVKARLLKTGRYRVTGYGRTGTVRIGERRSYSDPSF